MEFGKEFILENYNKVIDLANKEIEKKYSENAFFYRGSAYLKLKNYEAALNDFNSIKEENSFEVNFKKGVANFNLENFTDSHENLKKALPLAQNSEQRDKLNLWSNKLEIEIKERDIKINKVSDTSGIKVIHNWYQNGTHVFLNLELNTNLSSDEFTVEIQKKDVKLYQKNSNNVIFHMNIANSVIPEQSSFTINGRKVEIKLKKEIEHFNWVTVDRARVEETSAASKLASYPTSSKVKKDWDNLNKEITKELNEDAKNDPNEGMMSLFRQIYDRGDEATRRAMIKSMQTSGGTVLSTNWGEVADKDYEGRDRPDAPKGQEWKKPEF